MMFFANGDPFLLPTRQSQRLKPAHLISPGSINNYTQRWRPYRSYIAPPAHTGAKCRRNHVELAHGWGRDCIFGAVGNGDPRNRLDREATHARATLIFWGAHAARVHVSPASPSAKTSLRAAAMNTPAACAPQNANILARG